MPESALKRPTCFVIIGYGCRTDAATGRPLDLDKTFEQLIQRACDTAGINAFRAIDANLTGSIELLMHRWIWLADYVIADLTTLSANVFYELGVRHALRPSTTLLLANRTLMKSIPFDLSSFVVYAYDHPDEGEYVVTQDGDGPKFQPKDVEALTKRLTDLRKIVEDGSSAESRKPDSDSPVFVFLGDDLKERARQQIDEPARQEVLGRITTPAWVERDKRQRNENGSLADIIGLAKEHKRKKNFADAIRLYRTAIELSRKNKPKRAEPEPNDPHGDRPEMKVDVSLFQSLAEAIFLEAIHKNGREVGPFASPESERKIQIAKFRDALKILKDDCALDITADAETLRIAGKIYHWLFRWNRPADYLWPWRPYHWTWYRDFCRKFYFPNDVRNYFERAIDCYERAWSSKDLRLFAEQAEKVFLDVVSSTWNPVLKLQYYSESLTARRRANPEKKRRYGLVVASLALLLLGLGALAHAMTTQGRDSVPPPKSADGRDIVLPPGTPDPVLAELLRKVSEIQTTVGTTPDPAVTLVSATGDILRTVKDVDPRLKEIIVVLGRLRPSDLESVLALLNRVDRTTTQVERTTTRTATTVGDSAAPGGAAADSILELVRRIDGTTKSTSATVGDIRQKETPEPPSGMNNVASTATTILRELRRLRELHGPVPPPPVATTLSRTGPAMQFGTLPSAVRGFAYDLREGGSTPAPELGLKLDLLSIGQCPSTDAAGVAAGERVCTRIASISGQALVAGDGQSERLAREGVPLQVAKGRSRRDGWNDDDARRAVPFKDTQGFSYVMVVNRDARGLYAVVRRCSRECAP